MIHRKKVWTILTVVLLAAGLTAGLVLAQEEEDMAEIVETATERTTLMERVAAILGIEESVLADAYQQAHLQGIDEALAAGEITEDQAEAMKARIEARSAMQDVLDDAIASGALTEEQLELLHGPGRGQLRGQVIERIQGVRERVQALREQLGEESGECRGGRGAFLFRTQRGGIGGMWRRSP